MTYHIILELNRIAVKIDGGYVDRLNLYVDATETITIETLKTALTKYAEIKSKDPEKYHDLLYLIFTIDEKLCDEFEDKPDFSFEIRPGLIGVAAEFTEITVTILELTIIEIHEEIKNEPKF